VNLIEAIKSGRRFKRKSEIAWMSDDQLYNYVKADIIAEDWEIESQPVTITREQFDKAVHDSLRFRCCDDDSLFDLIAEKLGL
jgi:hypothetical protein